MKREKELLETVLQSARYFLERQEAAGEKYPFVDMKFDLVSGRDFDSSDARFKRRECLYGWIQGRGMESIAAHADFFDERKDSKTAARFDTVLKRISGRLDEMRRAHGRLFFAMNTDGAPLENVKRHSPDCVTFTDLFCTKGFFAAAKRLNRTSEAEAERRRMAVLAEAVLEGRFETDQIIFDTANPGGFVSGKFPQGAKMVALSGLALTGNHTLAEKTVQSILEHHLLPNGDFVESVDGAGRPYRESDGTILCDPGHAIEFVGLATRCLREKTSKTPLPELFRRVFDLGFSPSVHGIVKSVDLCSGAPVNSDMPWWSLPEAIRAGEALLTFAPEQSQGIEERVKASEDALLDQFIPAGTHGFACQMRNVRGEVSTAIPAVPDADPGYHTNLSLLDAFAWSKRRKAD